MICTICKDKKLITQDQIEILIYFKYEVYKFFYDGQWHITFEAAENIIKHLKNE